MKTCNKCKEKKPLEDFQVRSSNKDGRTGMCKECKREYDNAHYKANPERRAYIRSNSDDRIAKNRAWLYQHLLENPCADCDETDLVVLEFDHQSNKDGTISRAVQYWNLDRLQKEVDKCIIRCANCHRKKTARDFGFWKVGYGD